MLATNEEIHKNEDIDVLTFYEKIKLKNNIESLFEHYSGSYVFIEENPWTSEYTVRGKFHVKYGIFSKFELNFLSIEAIREYAEFIESLAFLKNSCDEIINPVLDVENNLVFLHNGASVNQENIESILESTKLDKSQELTNIKEEIKSLYSSIDDLDNDIKYKKEQIKLMESKIKEVKEAAETLTGTLKYITLVGRNSMFNRIKRIFVREQLKLHE